MHAAGFEGTVCPRAQWDRSGAPGVTEDYEAPRHPEIVATGGFDDIAIERLLAMLA